MSIDVLRFPPEIFAYICEFAGTISTIRFWLSGDVKVIQLLSAPRGLSIMHLQDMKMGSTSRWPTMLAQCRGLTVLTVKSPFKALPIPLKELESMKNLKVLHLHCFDSNRVAKSEFLPSFPKLEDLSLGELRSGLLSSCLPQTLTRLSLIFSDPIKDPFTVVEGYTMPNLTKFKIWNIYGLVLTTPLAFDLEELSVTSNLQMTDWRFPNTLTKLIWEPGKTPHNFNHWQYTNLVELTVHKVDLSGLSTLPMRKLNQLKKFIWNSRDSEPQLISTNMQPMFPASLEHLELNLRIKFEKALVLPPALQHLEILEMNDYTLVTELTPSEMTSMFTPLPGDEINFVDYIEKFTELGIPTSMKFLRLEHSNSNDDTTMISPSLFQHNRISVSLQTLRLVGVEIDQNPIELLPDTLTELSLYDTYPISDDQFLRFTKLRVLGICAPARNVNFNYFYNLPAGLLALGLHFGGNFDETILKHLSTGLEELDIAIENQEGNLAPTLSHDSFLLLQRFTKLKHLRLKIPISGVEDCMFETLPRSLTSLSLDFENRTKCTSGCFTHLPSNLKILEFNRLKSVDEAHYAYLPRGLRSLSIQFKGETTTNKHEIRSLHLAPGMPPALPSCVVFHNRYLTMEKLDNSSVNEERRLPTTGSTTSFFGFSFGFFTKSAPVLSGRVLG